METLLFCLPFLIFASLGVYSAFKSNRSSSKTTRSRTRTEEQVEDLHRMQTYNFWRDFDK